ncbi:MAG: B12-binding domain-containing radical SAM protein [Spirochaetes bacterium]|nr:B12-binding domain-containing radical SAM protein [Spirochaetota bacterium]
MKNKITIISPKREIFDPGRMEFWEFGFMAKAAGIQQRKYSGTPMALPILHSLIPDDFEVTVIDENVEDIDFTIETDLLLLTFFTTAATRGYAIADTFRERNVTVVIGGCHASMAPDEAITHADTVAIGEAEVLLPKILEDFRKGKLEKFYRVNDDERPALDNLPIPHFNCLKLNSYFNPTIQTMRGCPMKCDFCTVRVHWGSKYRYKPIEKVIEEIESLKKSFGRNTFIMISDDDIAANRNRSKELFRALIPLQIQWMSQGSMAMAKDDEYLDLMTQSGGTRMIMGFESVSEESLRLMKKNPANKLSDYIANIRKIQSYGVAIIGAFVFGFDTDGMDSFDNSADFIIDNCIALPQLFALTPFPGTALTKRLEEEGRILSRDWKFYTGSTVQFIPKTMTPEQLQNGYYYTIQKVYSYKNIWKRLNGLWRLWDENARRREPVIIKEKIDTLLLNENFRACAYSYPLNYNADSNEEAHYRKKLNTLLRRFLSRRTEMMNAVVDNNTGVNVAAI